MNYAEFFVQFEKDMNTTCIHCKKDCPCHKVAKYFRNVGSEQFKREVDHFSLPKDIQTGFDYYIHLVTDNLDI